MSTSKRPIPVFHVVCAAFLLLAVVILSTATDLGPFAPMFIAGGIYIAIFSIIAQGIYWGAAGVQRWARGRDK